MDHAKAAITEVLGQRPGLTSAQLATHLASLAVRVRPDQIRALLACDPRFAQLADRWRVAERGVQSPAGNVPQPREYVNPNDPAMAMARATRIEAAESRSQSRRRPTQLRDGKRLGRSGDEWTYRFALRDDLRLPDGVSCEVRVHQRSASGEVVSTTGRQLVINLAQDLGAIVPEAMLIADAAFLLERLAAALESSVRLTEDQRHVAGLVLSGRSEGIVPLTNAALPGGLNEEQQGAVREARSQRLLYLWGPPGTGKTTTVAAICADLLAAGASVLLVSNTNSAVDVAALKAAERLDGGKLLQEGVLVRFGKTATGGDLERRFGDRVVSSRILARRGEQIAAAIAAVEADIVTTKRAAQEGQGLPGRAQTLNRRAEKASAEADILLRKVTELRSAQAKHAERVARWSREVAVAESVGERQKFQRWISQESETATAEARRLQLLAHKHGEAQQLAAELKGEARRARRAAEAAEQDRPAAQLRLGGLQEERSRLLERAKGLFRRLAQEAQIVMTTSTMATHPDLRSRRFDYVIVDEASMLPLAATYAAAELADRAVVIAGDFRQLPPIVTSEGPECRRWLARDAFTEGGVPQAVSQERFPVHLAVLREQHRMNSAISEVISEVFYPERRLRNAKGVNDKPPIAPEVRSERLWLVDTGSLNPWCAPGGSRSRLNLMHAQVVQGIVERLLKDGRNPAEASQLAVISPYRHQVSLLQAALADSLGESAAGVANTVHSFQGGERDTVILDLTEASGRHPYEWFAHKQLAEEGSRLLNVAASRARQLLIVVGDFGYLAEHVEAAATSRRMLRALSPAAARLKPGDLGIDVVDFDRLRDDIRRAERSIFLSLRSAERLSVLHDELARRAREGVLVNLLLPGLPRAHTMLSDSGVICDQQDPVRANCVVIDDNLVYALSHGATPVTYLRSQASGFGGRLVDLLEHQRGPRDPKPRGEYRTSDCPECGEPRVRRIFHDGRAWDECRRDACGRSRPAPVPSSPRVISAPARQVSAWQPGRQVAHSWLVDDK